jgi:hypothetical protein
MPDPDIEIQDKMSVTSALAALADPEAYEKNSGQVKDILTHEFGEEEVKKLLRFVDKKRKL